MVAVVACNDCNHATTRRARDPAPSLVPSLLAGETDCSWASQERKRLESSGRLRSWLAERLRVKSAPADQTQDNPRRQSGILGSLKIARYARQQLDHDQS